jgi:hypothetical protein
MFAEVSALERVSVKRSSLASSLSTSRAPRSTYTSAQDGANNEFSNRMGREKFSV